MRSRSKSWRNENWVWLRGEVLMCLKMGDTLWTRELLEAGDYKVNGKMQLDEMDARAVWRMLEGPGHSVIIAEVRMREKWK